MNVIFNLFNLVSLFSRSCCMNETNNTKERRLCQRKTVGFEVQLSNGKGDALIMQAVNKSDTGLYVLSEGEDRPALGAKVKVKLNDQAENELLDMLVTRIDRFGVGLQFVKHSEV